MNILKVAININKWEIHNRCSWGGRWKTRLYLWNPLMDWAFNSVCPFWTNRQEIWTNTIIRRGIRKARKLKRPNSLAQSVKNHSLLLYIVKLASQQLRKELHRVYWSFFGLYHQFIFMIWIGHFVELTETIKNNAYRISIGIHSLLIPFNKSVTSGAQSLIFFINLYIRLQLILFLAWSVISTSSTTRTISVIK